MFNTLTYKICIKVLQFRQKRVFVKVYQVPIKAYNYLISLHNLLKQVFMPYILSIDKLFFLIISIL